MSQFATDLYCQKQTDRIKLKFFGFLYFLIKYNYFNLVFGKDVFIQLFLTKKLFLLFITLFLNLSVIYPLYR